MFIQWSILFFYLKHLKLPHFYRITVYILTFSSTLWCLLRIVGNISCHAPSKNGDGKCVKIGCVKVALGVAAMALDLVIWSLPIRPLIKSTKESIMPPKVRTGVLAAFAVGLLACIVTMPRIGAIIAEVQHEEDMSRRPSLIIIYDQLEIGLGVVAACIPSLRRLLVLEGGDGDQRQRGSCDRIITTANIDRKESNGDYNYKDIWSQQTVPPQSPRKLGPIHFGPRGHLDLDVEGLGVLDSRVLGAYRQQQPIELKEIEKMGCGEDLNNNTTSFQPADTISATAPTSSPKDAIGGCGGGGGKGKSILNSKGFSFGYRGTGGGSGVTNSCPSPPKLDSHCSGNL